MGVQHKDAWLVNVHYLVYVAALTVFPVTPYLGGNCGIIDMQGMLGCSHTVHGLQGGYYPQTLQNLNANVWYDGILHLIVQPACCLQMAPGIATSGPVEHTPPNFALVGQATAPGASTVQWH